MILRTRSLRPYFVAMLASAALMWVAFFATQCQPQQATAAVSTSKTVLTGAYPTGAPSTLTANAVSVTDSPNVDFAVRVSAGTGTVTALCYLVGFARWVPLGDMSLDSSVYGGVAYARYTPGLSNVSHCMIWEKTAGATYTSAYILSDIQR